MSAGRTLPGWLDAEPEERVWLHVTPSKSLVLVGVALGFVLLVVVSVIVGTLGDILVGRTLSAVMLVSLVGLLVGPFLLSERREYLLTDRRVVRRSALTRRDETELRVEAVDSVALEQSTWQQWVGVGDVRFVAGGGAPDLRFAHLDEPAQVFQQVSDRLAGE